MTVVSTKYNRHQLGGKFKNSNSWKTYFLAIINCDVKRDLLTSETIDISLNTCLAILLGKAGLQIRDFLKIFFLASLLVLI